MDIYTQLTKGANQSADGSADRGLWGACLGPTPTSPGSLFYNTGQLPLGLGTEEGPVSWEN